MTVLNDAALRELFPDATPGPSSVDLHLGDTLLRLAYGVTLDPEKDQSSLWEAIPRRSDGRWMLGQGALYLGVTRETITIPESHMALLHGLSSLGRMGLLVHCTAGLADPGFHGQITLEMVSLGGAILLRPEQRVGQITLHALSSPAEHPYAGRYQGDTGPVPSRAHLDRRPS